MKATILYSCCLLIIAPMAHAQYAQLAHKPYSQRLDAIHQLYWQVMGLRMAPEAVADTLAGMRTLAKKLNDAELLMEADLLEAYYDYQFISGDIRLIQRIWQEGQDAQIAHIACRAGFLVAGHYWVAEEYAQSFRWYLRLDSLMQNLEVADFPNKVEYLERIGSAYYQFGDYEQAIGYFQVVADLPIDSFYLFSWRHSLNNMGLAYQKLDKLDVSDSCFMRLSEFVSGNEQWRGIIAGNLGYNQYLRGNHEAAIPLLDTDFRIARQYEDYGLAAGSAIPLADILTHRGNWDEARFYLDWADEYLRKAGQTDRLRFFYPVLAKWYATPGKGQEAAAYLDSAVFATKEYNEKFNALKLLRANQEVLANQRETAIQQFRAQSERQIGRRNLILALLLVVVLVIFFLHYRQRQISRLRLKDRNLKLLEAERELVNARSQLERLAREAMKRNQRIFELEQGEQLLDNRELIEQLGKQTILTDEGWRRFSELFDQVHPGFQQALKERYPTLTSAEIRCLAMEKLRFGNKEMAALQGISTNAVMVTKHRIRKKLQLPDQEAVEQCIASI